jgi:hypothetical protein
MCQSHELEYETMQTTNIRLEVGKRKKMTRDVRWGDLWWGNLSLRLGRSMPSGDVVSGLSSAFFASLFFLRFSLIDFNYIC